MPKSAWQKLYKHFASVDKAMAVKSLRAFLYLVLSTGNKWKDSSNIGVYISHDAVQRLYEMGRNSIRVADLPADLARYRIKVKVEKQNIGSNRSIYVAVDLQMPQAVRDSVGQLLAGQRATSDQVWAHTGEPWNAIPDAATGAFIEVDNRETVVEPGPLQSKVISVLESDFKWYVEVKDHLDALGAKAALSLEAGDANFMAYRRNMAILRKMDRSDGQRYMCPQNSGRIYGDSFNQLSRDIRNELESRMNWTVVDIKACQLSLFAYTYGFDECIKLLESSDGFWSGLLEGFDLSLNLKATYKKSVQSLLFGRTEYFARDQLAFEVGSNAAERFIELPAIQEIISGMSNLRNGLIAGNEMEFPDGDLRSLPPDSKQKDAKSFSSIWAQAWEMHYTGNLLLAANEFRPGSIRAMLHDGITLDLHDEDQIQNLHRKIQELTEGKKEVLRLGIS